MQRDLICDVKEANKGKEQRLKKFNRMTSNEIFNNSFCTEVEK